MDYTDFNDTDFTYENEPSLKYLFETTVASHAKETAVLIDDEEVKYEDLNKMANRMANQILQHGVAADDIIAVMIPRSLDMIISIYSVVKTGAAYMPIDPNLPIYRIETILKKSGTKKIICDPMYMSKLNNLYDIQVYNCSKLLENESCEDNPNVCPAPTDLAYVIYTSGSTGNPKGVMIENRSIINRINWMQFAYPLKEDDVIIQKTPFDFDVSVWELFWWAFVGCRCAVLNVDFHKSPAEIINLIEKDKVSVIHFVPSMLDIFLEYLTEFREQARLKSLKYVFCSGESLKPSTVNKFNSLIGTKQDSQLANLYGPTEAAVDVSFFNIKKDIEYINIPIGKPIHNIKLYVLNSDNKLVDINEEGELYISGIGVARGYLNEEELTNKFFSIDSNNNNSRMYKTGDLVRRLPDGNIEFIGRIDNQVKLRGFRIELNEIEYHLLNYSGIKNAVALVQESNHGIKQLIAYIVVDEDCFNSQSELKNNLNEILPKHMVPEKIVKVDSIPLNSNGKIDRKKIIELYEATSDKGETSFFKEPVREKTTQIINSCSSDIGSLITEIWTHLLGSDIYDTSMNFFDLGGNSLMLIKEIVLIKEKVGINVNVLDLFKYTTIDSLSEYLNSKQ